MHFRVMGGAVPLLRSTGSSDQLNAGPFIWVKCFDTARDSTPDSTNEICTRLRGSGLELLTSENGAQEPPNGVAGAIVLFAQTSSGLIDFLQNFGMENGHRILAVALEPITGEDAWRIMAAGACDVITWHRLADPAAVIFDRTKRWVEVDRLVACPLIQENLIGNSDVWIAALRRIVETARYTDASMLLIGQSGTGKELLAKVIHHLDRRNPKGNFALLDCTTVVPELFGSEFYGHERGAFTTAVGAREGVFASADGGTLFLDEVGELPLRLQAGLLRVIQERTYKPVGGNVWKRADFRLVCATNRDLEKEEADGNFRRDFYYRIAGNLCRIPPLSERREDIPLLVKHFLGQLCHGTQVPELDPFVQDYLRVREYPGNIRELRHLVAQIAGRYIGHGPITIGHIPDDERPKVSEMMGGDWRQHMKLAVRHAMLRGASLRAIGSGASQTAIETAISDEAGNLQRAARRLGVTGRALQMRRAASRDAEDAAEKQM